VSGGVTRQGASALCVVLLSVTACSGGSSSDDAAQPDAPARPTTAPDPTDDKSVAGAEPDADRRGGPELEPAATDLADFACTRTWRGSWKVSGAIVNTGTRPTRYTLTVVTLGDADDVVGQRVERLQVDDGDTAAFRWPRFAGGTAETCMPRLQREPA